MKKSKKFATKILMVLFALSVFSLTGCGQIRDDIEQVDTAVPSEFLETEPKSTEVQSDVNITHTQEQGGGTSSIMRAYSDREKERMEELKQSYLNETAKPEKMIQEVDSPEAVTEGTLCYIRSTGEYYLPDKELTDEELLEIIDCNFRIAVNSQGWTQEKIDEADQRDRAIREEKIKAAGGISEDEAIEIARKAMETDIGETAKELEVVISSDYTKNGRKLYLFEDDGVVYYSVHFANKEEVIDPEDFCHYNCKVNAVDGSIYEANSISGDVGLYWDYDDFIWYEH